MNQSPTLKKKRRTEKKEKKEKKRKKRKKKRNIESHVDIKRRIKNFVNTH